MSIQREKGAGFNPGGPIPDKIRNTAWQFMGEEISSNYSRLVFASGCKTARVVVHIFISGISLSGFSGGGVGGGGGGRNNVNVDTFLRFAFGIIWCGCVSGVSGGGVGGVGGGVITSMWTPS